MEVTRGRDWTFGVQDISGIGVINQMAYGSYQCNNCATQANHSSLKGCNDTSPFWVVVTWNGGRLYCHQIGADRKYELEIHTRGEVLTRGNI